MKLTKNMLKPPPEDEGFSNSPIGDIDSDPSLHLRREGQIVPSFRFSSRSTLAYRIEIIVCAFRVK